MRQDEVKTRTSPIYDMMRLVDLFTVMIETDRGMRSTT